MAEKFLDNFTFWDDTDPGQPGTFTTTPSATTVTVGDHLRIDSSGQGGALISDQLTPQSTYYLNARVNFANNIINNGCVWELRDGGLFGQAGMDIRVDGKLRFYRGSFLSGTTDIGLPSLIALNLDTDITFYDVEAKIVIGNPGTIECRVNGGVEIGPSAAVTQNTSNATADSVRLTCNTGTRSEEYYWEHVVLTDGSGPDLNANFLGPIDVVLLPPTGSGFYSGWGFSGAPTDWQAVLTADGDTSYINAAVVGTQTTFTHPGLPAGSTAVLATGVWVNMREDDAVTRGYKVLMRDPSGPTDALGATEFFAGPDYIYKLQPFEVSPFTGVQWTVAEINQPVEFGVQVTT